MDVPDVLDLEHLRGKGQQENEEAMPQDDENDNKSEPSFVFNEDMLKSLTDMGFSLDAAKRALYNTQTNPSIDQATNWLFAHMDDEDLNNPFTVPGSLEAAASNRPDISAYTDNPNFVIDDNALQNLLIMGMVEEQSRLALHFTVSLLGGYI